MTAQQWRFMPARRAQHCKKEANVCWLGEHAVSHHKLAVQFRRRSGRTNMVVSLEQTKQVCQCTLRSVSGKGDTEEQARKNAEELVTNVAKNFATGSIGCSDLFSCRNDLIKAGGRRRRSTNGPVKLPMTLLTRPRKKVRPARRCRMMSMMLQRSATGFSRCRKFHGTASKTNSLTNWETHVSDC